MTGQEIVTCVSAYGCDWVTLCNHAS